MIGKKINQLATELAPVSTDLTIIGDPDSGVSKKITLAQLGAIFSGAVSFYTDLAGFPAVGDINVIYCAKDTQKLYLWNGSAYVEVFPSQALLDTYQLRSEKGVSNGYASLDSGGKVPISQLPSSIMEYKGTWNAATNAPTLANGTGDTGDVYICNVAGTVNFGAGPITFAVGDYVIYSGSIWQRSSGAVGTVTSVALTVGGDAISVSGSPLTTSGTLALAFAGTSAQYINGAGNLITFPTSLISGSGASGQVTFFNGANSVTGTNNFFWDATNNRLGIGTTTPQRSIEIYNTTADNHLRLSGNAPSVSMGEAVTGSIYQAKFGLVTTNGQFVSAGVAGDFVIISQTGATIIGTSSTEKMRVNTSGNVSINNTNNTYKLDVTGTGRFTGQLRLESTITDGTNTYTLPSATGTLALTSDIPSVTGYVPYTGATANLDLGTHTLLAKNLVINHSSGSGVAASITKGGSGEALTVVKSSGSGNAASITGGVTLLSELHLTTDLADAYIASATNWNTAYSLRITSATSPLSITSNVISIAQASGSTNGYLSSTDWTTFNNKQNALTNPVTGTGTTNYLPKFTGASTIGNSLVFDNGTNVGIGTASPSGKLHIAATTGTAAPGSIALAIRDAGNSGFGFDFNLEGVATGDLYLMRTVSGTQSTVLQIARATGAATFSSIVGIGMTPITANGGLQIGNSGGAAPQIYYTNGTAAAYFGVDAYGTNVFGGGTTGAYPFIFITSSTERMRITGAGNVGIGTTGGNGKLSVCTVTTNLEFDTDANGSYLLSFNRSAGTYRQITFRGSDFIFSPSDSEKMRFTNAGNLGIGTSSPVSISGYTALTLNNATTGGILTFQQNGTNKGSIYNDASNITIGVNTGATIFENNGAERMRITSGGALLVGSTSATGGFDHSINNVTNQGSIVFNQLSSDSNPCAGFWNNATSGNNIFQRFFINSGGNLAGSIDYNRAFGVTGFNTTSDYRIKSEITDFNALSILSNLKPKEFKIGNASKRSIGFIAHELQEYLPQAVNGVKDAVDKNNNPIYQSVDYSQLTGLLTKAIQELKQELDTLKNK
jgi:hypothetical protein